MGETNRQTATECELNHLLPPQGKRHQRPFLWLGGTTQEEDHQQRFLTGLKHETREDPGRVHVTPENTISSTSQQKHANFGSDTWSVKKDICELLNDPSIKKIITKLQNFCKTARTTAPSSGADDSYWHTSAVQLKTKLYIKKRLWLDQLEKCNVALC